MLQTPVLFLIFNRPDRTKEVFQQIKNQQPRKLYIVSDGARKGKNEEQQVLDCRTIVQQIDWQCEFKTLFRDENLGSGIGVFEGINWFFEQEEQGIKHGNGGQNGLHTFQRSPIHPPRGKLQNPRKHGQQAHDQHLRW